MESVAYGRTLRRNRRLDPSVKEETGIGRFARRDTGSITLPVEWSILWLTASACGGVYAIRMLIASAGLNIIPGSDYLPFLPGAMFGLYRFITSYSPARIPFVAVSLLIIAGLSWTSPYGLTEGVGTVVLLLLCMSVSVVFNSKERWLFGAKWFCIGAVVSSVPLLLFWITAIQRRLGEAYVDNVRIADANNVGAFFVVAVVAQLTLLWNYPEKKPVQRWFQYAMIGWFVVIIALTMSRGSLIALVGSVIVFFFIGRLKENLRIIVVGGVLATVGIAVYWVRNGMPTFLSRFTSETAGTLGSRTMIWQGALDLMNQWNVGRLIFGEGTGSARYSLGEFAPELGRMLRNAPTHGPNSGVALVSSHSSYIDWVLMYGGVGLFVGFLFLVNATLNSWRIDRDTRGAAALALFAIFIITGATTVIHDMGTDTIACSGIALGYIYMQHTRDRLSHRANNQASIEKKQRYNRVRTLSNGSV